MIGCLRASIGAATRARGRGWGWRSSARSAAHIRPKSACIRRSRRACWCAWSSPARRLESRCQAERLLNFQQVLGDLAVFAQLRQALVEASDQLGIARHLPRKQQVQAVTAQRCGVKAQLRALGGAEVLMQQVESNHLVHREQVDAAGDQLTKGGFIAGPPVDSQLSAGFGLLKGCAVVIAAGAGRASALQIGHLLPVKAIALAVEQVVTTFHHRVADKELFLTFAAVQPYRAAGALAAFGQLQRACPGVELPGYVDALQSKGFGDDA